LTAVTSWVVDRTNHCIVLPYQNQVTNWRHVVETWILGPAVDIVFVKQMLLLENLDKNLRWHLKGFWHLLYNNLHWKISKWSEIISWCIFAQSRLYAFLKKQFPEITTIAFRTIIPWVCVLKVCIELYLLPSSPRLLYFRCSKVPILIEI